VHRLGHKNDSVHVSRPQQDCALSRLFGCRIRRFQFDDRIGRNSNRACQFRTNFGFGWFRLIEPRGTKQNEQRCDALFVKLNPAHGSAQRLLIQDSVPEEATSKYHDRIRWIRRFQVLGNRQSSSNNVAQRRKGDR
jgi:hypothetical protein